MENKATGGKNKRNDKNYLAKKLLKKKPRNWMRKSLNTSYNKTRDAIKHLLAVLITEKENINTK